MKAAASRRTPKRLRRHQALHPSYHTGSKGEVAISCLGVAWCLLPTVGCRASGPDPGIGR
jgi:hypothetical protein